MDALCDTWPTPGWGLSRQGVHYRFPPILSLSTASLGRLLGFYASKTWSCPGRASHSRRRSKKGTQELPDWTKGCQELRTGWERGIHSSRGESGEAAEERSVSKDLEG